MEGPSRKCGRRSYGSLEHGHSDVEIDFELGDGHLVRCVLIKIDLLYLGENLKEFDFAIREAKDLKPSWSIAGPLGTRPRPDKRST